MDPQLVQRLGQQLFRQKVLNKEFRLAKYEPSLQDKQRRSDKRNKKQAVPTLGHKINLELQLFAKDKSITYLSLAPLNRLWQSYIQQLLPPEESMQSKFLKLLRADLHGAKVGVLYSRDASLEGFSGILVKETLKSFVIVSDQDQQRRVLKQQCIFVLMTGSEEFKVLGSQLVVRSSDRMKHKFRAREKARKLFSEKFLI